MLSAVVLHGDGKMDSTWNLETTRRLSAAIIGFSATPAFVGLAYLRWVKGTRRELPSWRNGMGLASMVIISGLWLFQTTTVVVWLLRIEFGLLLPAIYFWIALPLACALKGAPRLLMVAAWVSVQLFYGAAMYA